MGWPKKNEIQSYTGILKSLKKIETKGNFLYVLSSNFFFLMQVKFFLSETLENKTILGFSDYKNYRVETLK